MLDVGILIEESRMERFCRSPLKKEHALLVSRLTQILSRNFDEGYHVRVQLPLALDDFNEPEPDLAVVRLDQYPDDEDEHPSSALLVIEVSEPACPSTASRKPASTPFRYPRILDCRRQERLSDRPSPTLG